ncbi:TSUP family transporter [Pluralibacter gergoviae]|uniref:TSUP family transporter n=1 Tax=Pluralibacter gergoviae TaxID=61647 RepID=UPI0012D7D489|nr:TSUP family transporter [Pluralibacter gergoviae]
MSVGSDNHQVIRRHRLHNKVACVNGVGNQARLAEACSDAAHRLGAGLLLHLNKARLVQALGLSFTVSTLALWAGLWRHNGWQMGLLAPSVWATVPAIAGMWAGQKISRRLSAAAFRRCFLGVLLLLGAELILRPLVG